MAGIGFELKKLFNDRSATGYIKAYGCSAVVTAGPFALMTGMVLMIQVLFRIFDIPYPEMQLYTASVIYPFIFSHIASSGFVMVITRYLADQLYSGKTKDILSSLYGMSVIALFAASIIAIAFFWNKPLNFSVKVYTYVFYLEMIVVWVQGAYLTAIKDYKGLLVTYAFGVAISILLTLLVLYVQIMPPVKGALLAMDFGNAYIMLRFFIYIGRYFGWEKSRGNFLFLPYFEQHKCLFFIAFIYTIALYLPNLLIWQGPLGVWIENTYIYAPMYDVATFYAFLSIMPVMILFVVSTELHFYEKYVAYFSYITDKGNFREIEDAKQELLQSMWSELRNIIEFQLVFTIVFLALGNYFLPMAGLTYTSVNMYNLIVLGAYFTGVMQVAYTILLYFEDQQGVLWIVSAFFILNTVFGGIGLWNGQESYGFTFFLAAAISCVLTIWRLSYFCKRINYYVFCSRPVFYQERKGPFSRITQWIYKET
jgi:polysaccharide biosynthesis protein PelG